MALQTSGPISLNQIHVEAGGSSGTTASLNDADIRGLIGKSSGAQMSFNEWYGAANTFTYTISSNTQELNLTSTYFTNVGWNGSSNIILTIGSGVYIWSDNTTTAGMTIASSLNGKLTIVNNGYIIGKGGAGGGGSGNFNQAGFAGGPAIANSATGVSITNASGAYIAGGGGGGGANSIGPTGGGGCAGGGQGGALFTTAGGAGGAVGLAGADGAKYGSNSIASSKGGGAGGGGGIYYTDPTSTGYSGAGGGRILTGTGGNGANNNFANNAGGSGGNAGGNSSNTYYAGGGYGAGRSKCVRRGR